MSWYAQPNISTWAGFGTTINTYTYDLYGTVIILIIFIVFMSASIKKGISSAFGTGAIFSMIGAVLLSILGWAGPNTILITMALSGIALALIVWGGVKD